ncbi:hypothetical protein QTP70_004256 [Hemibagrus guttatus]|uniref:ribonuclease H n=1 Tax=Hemibagrus guttatus TaxID=175788 RepID=A0AAE0UL34_9TELE|nr:hypothetical protein QTP70_004256 [Hemibagrus guttatus]
MKNFGPLVRSLQKNCVLGALSTYETLRDSHKGEGCRQPAYRGGPYHTCHGSTDPPSGATALRGGLFPHDSVPKEPEHPRFPLAPLPQPDYRGVNAVTVRYPYLLPLVPVALEQLRGTKISTKLDLRSAYNLVRIRAGDKWKTTFHTTKGHYKYLVMTFGLTNVRAVFQSFINEILRDMIRQYVITYIDDILIFSSLYNEHVEHVWRVLARLLQHRLFVNVEKGEFHHDTITFLGYVISQKGVQMDERKVEAVTNWPKPTTMKEQRFTNFTNEGFTNFYRRFIIGYSSIASPLTSLLKGPSKHLRWTEEARGAFMKLKCSFATAPILRHPDLECPFIV